MFRNLTKEFLIHLRQFSRKKAREAGLLARDAEYHTDLSRQWGRSTAYPPFRRRHMGEAAQHSQTARKHRATQQQWNTADAGLDRELKARAKQNQQ